VQTHSLKVLLVSAQSKSARRSHVTLPAFAKTPHKLCAMWANVMRMPNHLTVRIVSVQSVVLLNALVSPDPIIVSASLKKWNVPRVSAGAASRETLSHADVQRLKSVLTISLFWWKMNALTNVIRRMSRVKEVNILSGILWVIALVSVVLTDAPTRKTNCWRTAPALEKRARRGAWELRF